MANDSSYKLSLIFALVLHFALVFFLTLKVTHSRSATVSAAATIINAMVIDGRYFNRPLETQTVSRIGAMQPERLALDVLQKPQSLKQPVAIKKLVIHEELQLKLKKNLLATQASELAALKKEKRKYQALATKQKEQAMHKLLEEQLHAEQQQLAASSPTAVMNQVPDPGGGQVPGIAGNQLFSAVDKYKALIKEAIAVHWVMPAGVNAGDFCRLLISMAPGGIVVEVKLTASSGNAALERSAQAAIFKASPLPVSEDPKLFDQLRTIMFTFRPEGIVGT